jgi:predicted MPP superfamily phosphohydrolase
MSFVDVSAVLKVLSAAALIGVWRNTFTVWDPTQSVALERLQLSKAPSMRIVQLSDLHADINWRRGINERILNNVFDQVAAEAPDLIVLTGDYVNKSEKAVVELESFMRRLVELVGAGRVIGTIGNHDAYGERDSAFILAQMRDYGVTMLVNETVVIEELNLAVVGLGDLKTGSFNAADGRKSLDAALAALGTRADSVDVLVLSHNPDSAPIVNGLFPEAQLMLSGHTHGGQICLPGVPLPPLWGRFVFALLPRFVQRLLPSPHRVIQEWGRYSGLYEIAGESFRQLPRSEGLEARAKAKNLLYINRGLGTHFPFRLFCSPEITVIDM